MAEVHLRPAPLANYRECFALQVSEIQTGLVASNTKSLAEGYANSMLTLLAVHDVVTQ